MMLIQCLRCALPGGNVVLVERQSEPVNLIVDRLSLFWRCLSSMSQKSTCPEGERLSVCETDYPSAAAAWRRERGNEGIPIRTGFVVFFAGKVAGWTCDLSEVRGWRPGCVAIGPLGVGSWTASGGNYWDGADEWVRTS